LALVAMLLAVIVAQVPADRIEGVAQRRGAAENGRTPGRRENGTVRTGATA
jgi:hypothetical protein